MSKVLLIYSCLYQNVSLAVNEVRLRLTSAFAKHVEILHLQQLQAMVVTSLATKACPLLFYSVEHRFYSSRGQC
jgi:hypothetical protein